MDLLSKLPDEVLCHTLSFLTTKEAAVTSVLSKRWRNLLAFVPNLHIDDSIFLHPEEGKRDRNEIRQSFVEFVDRILALQDYPLVKMENLLEARISLLVTEDQIERAREPNNDGVEDGEDDVVLRFGNVGKLMNGIRNVQYLDLSANTLEVLSLCCESMPVFKNLKTLSLKSEESRGWQAMAVLLKNSPHLETLVLEGLLHYVTDKCGDACDCVTREEKGRSLTSCPVKVLEIKGFQGTMKEMHMIKHFLDYFPCLKEIKIYIDENAITPEVSKVIAERMEFYNKLSNCNVQLLVSG